MRDLQVVAKECMEDLIAIGYKFPREIVFKSSNRMTRTWGSCTVWKSRPTEIKIAGFLLADDVPIKQLRTTILHELAHAIDENKHSHGYEWQKIVKDISDCYGLDIQQYCTKEEIENLMNTKEYHRIIEKRKEKSYKFRCDKCGKILSYNRKPKWYNKETGHIEDGIYHLGCYGNIELA